MASSPVIIQVATPGPPGPAGPSGATGPAGYSPRYYVQAGVPTSGVGLAGDMYINSTNSDVWGPKIDNTTWPATPACNIRGIAGYSPLYIVAAGTPPGATGNIGDMYINSTTSDLYGPKSAGGWGPIVANLKGATGSTGPQGPPGVAAIPRGAWASGVLYNQGDLVTDASQSWICLVNHTSSAGNRPSLPSPATWQATAAGGTQTPWATDIDGNTKTLNNAGGIGIGGAASSSKLGITAGTLATTAGAGVIFHSSVAQTPNTDEFSTVLTRPTAGTDWTTALWRLARKVDSTEVAAVEFGSYSVALRTLGLQRVLVNSAGNVGIGTASFPIGTAPIATRGYLTLKGSPDAGVLELAHSGTDGTGVLCGQVAFVDGNQAGADKRAVIFNAATAGATAGNRGGLLQIFTKADGGAVAERVRITEVGNVGIGSTSPGSRLTVLPSVTPTTVAAANQIAIGEALNSSLYRMSLGYGQFTQFCGVIQATDNGAGSPLLLNPIGGNVGIGVTAPASRLHVGGPQNATGGISIATDTNDPTIYGYQIYRGAAGELNLIGNQSGAAAFVFGNPTERMRIAAGGNVGIGVASPASLLDLRTPGISANTDVLTLSAGSTGATNAEQRIKFVSAGTYNLGYIGVGFDPTTAVDGYIAFGTGGNGAAAERVRIAYNGNVGIKTQTPADALTVGGITYAANSNGGIRIQSAGAEWAMRMALKSDSGGIPRGAFEFGGVELFAINGVGIAIKKAAAVYPLDVFGDINYTGTLRQNGNPVSFGGEGTVYVAYASTFLALTTTRQDVPGATVTLTRAGRYLITGVFSFNKPTGTSDQDVSCLGSLVAGGSLQTQEAVFCVLGGATVGGIATVAQQWVYVATAGAVAKLQAYKNAGTGASATEATKTSISAVWIAST